MKHCRRLDSLALAFVAAGYLMAPMILKAADAAASDSVTKLLDDTKALTAQLKADSEDMDTFARSVRGWSTYADQLNTLKGHINNAGKLLTKLKDAESTGSRWQQMTVKRIEPLLQEMANNLTAAIKHLNENQSKIHLPEFKDYVSANAALARDMDQMVRASIDYGADSAKLERASGK